MYFNWAIPYHLFFDRQAFWIAGVEKPGVAKPSMVEFGILWTHRTGGNSLVDRVGPIQLQP